MQKYHTFTLALCLLVLFATQLANAEDTIMMEFFYTEGCEDCETAKPIIDEIEQNYSDNIIVERLEVAIQENWEHFISYNLTVVPAVVINYEVKIPDYELTKEKFLEYVRQNTLRATWSDIEDVQHEEVLITGEE